MDSGNIQTVTRIIRIYKRWSKFLGALILALLLAGFAFWLTTSNAQDAGFPADIAGIAPFLYMFATLMVVFSSITFIGQGKKFTATKNSADGKVIYEDTTGDAVYHKPIENTSRSEADLAQQHALAVFAPVITNGVASIGFLGRREVRNQENTVILTEKYLVAAEIPVTEGTHEGVGGTAGVIASVLPGAQAEVMNVMMSSLNSGAAEQAIDKVLSEQTIQQITAKYYSFIIPRDEVISVRKTGLGNIEVRTSGGKKYSWGCVRQENIDNFLANAQQQGLVVTTVEDYRSRSSDDI